VSFDVAAVVVHIDLEGDRPHSSSLVALAAGRQLASSWGATLYAALIAKDTSGIDAAALGKAGADKIMVATTDTPIAPLWAAVGNAWQAVLDQLRPRIVLFGADAPSAPELAPRTGARIGARLLVRARTFGGDEIELRDRDGGYVRASDGGAAVALVGRAGEAVPGEDDADIVVIAGGSGDARIELAGAVAAEVAHTVGAVVALGEDAAKDPALVARANQLAQQLGAIVVGPVEAARAGAIAPGAVVDRQTPLAPELCVVVGDAKVDLAGSTSVIKIGAQPGKLVDGALPGPVAAGLASLVDKLGRTA
jgi:electron transfer flavoprotein alpha subunit